MASVAPPTLDVIDDPQALRAKLMSLHRHEDAALQVVAEPMAAATIGHDERDTNGLAPIHPSPPPNRPEAIYVRSGVALWRTTLAE